MEVPSTISELLPKPLEWENALEPFIMRLPNPSLAMTNPFGSAVMMIQAELCNAAPSLPRAISRDQDGRSVLLRILQYVTKLARTTEVLSKISEDETIMLVRYVALSVQLAEDNISIFGAMPLWIIEDPEIEAEIIDSIYEARRFLIETLQATLSPGLAGLILARLLEASEGLSFLSYYHARAYVTAVDDLSSVTKSILIPKSDFQFKIISNSEGIFASMAILMSTDDGSTIKNFNELLSLLTDQNFGPQTEESQQEGFRRLLLMDCLLQRSVGMLQEIPQQRLIFYVKHALSEIRTASFAPSMELIRSLPSFLLAIKDIYGSFWGEALDLAEFVRKYPFDDKHLTGYYACFKVCTTLANVVSSREILKANANDDLVDALIDRKQSMMQIAIRLLEEASSSPDGAHRPRRIFNDLLSHLIGRLLEDSSAPIRVEMEPLYPVLASESITLQQTAFDLLHEQISLKQEQVSLDKALTNNFEAKLPEELLSLILAPPGSSELSESLQYGMPASLRTYLLSWSLVFAHWKNASNTLQMDYAKSLAEGTFLADLLGLTFAVLIGSNGKAIDVSNIATEISAIDVETPERETHQLLSHLYFLCLKYLPTQSKAWWRDSTSRQTNIAVEAWTEKHFSKLIIASELDTVREWAPSQEEGDQPLTIKILSSAHEISASIPVDEDSMVLVIRLPPSYPLARAEVEGVRRVGVPEKKWISWIRNTQGQLTIASEGGANALIDCLLAWRKNVTATMKGQSECAICYSVVGVDRTLPSKVCKTCKNKFHGSCLFRCESLHRISALLRRY